MNLRAGHAIHLLRSGSEFFPALESAIAASLYEVRLETYIFQFDEQGQLLAQAMEAAARRGVAVHLVMDGVGSAEVSLEWVQRWRAAGVQWQRFSPLGALGLLVPGRWRRMHRKLCVVDGTLAFCGGINILSDWLDTEGNRQAFPRFDFALQVQGPLVTDVRAAMVQFWGRLETTQRVERLQWREAARSWRNWRMTPLPSAGTQGGTNGMVTGARAALVLRDNVRHRRDIEKVYRKALGLARTEVVIACAYFAPSAKIRRALLDAVRRGVRVRLLLNTAYENFLQFHAARPLYGALLRGGVELYEYQGGMLHAKVAVVDGHWMTVGSSNLDPLSLQLAREANVVVEDVHLAQSLREALEQAILKHGQRLDVQALAQRPWLQRQRDWLAYAVMRLILFLTGRRY